jgi:TolB-like protein/Tfp pilus assembly protein PilF
LVGQTVGHFEVIEKIGTGGMGVVYKARDLSLDRLVALKFLPPAVSQDEEAVARLVREAQTASALDHPNICTIYEVSQTPEGQMFIAMGYYEGETLAQRLRQGPLPVATATHVATEVAEGLAKAHRHGVIHRDVKPGNIIFTSEGSAKILDFGLAKFGDSLALTRTRTTVGTINYMSPEQLQGDPVDHRADIWAWGIVFYQMLTGRLPFRGEQHGAVMHSILNEPLDLNLLLGGTVPSGLIRILSRALEKSPVERYSQMTEALLEIRTAIGTGPESTRQLAVKRATPSVAVLPFRNLSSDPEDEYFSDGLAEELTDALTRLDGLQVASRTSAFAFKGSQQGLAEIGAKLRVGLVLEGSVRRSGKRLRITVQLTNVAEERGLWSERFDRELEDVFAIQEEIAARVVSTLKLRLGDDATSHLVKRYTQNLVAYNLYLKGRYQWNRSTPEALLKAVESFEQAVAEDPNYVSPFCGLADCYLVLGARALLPPKAAWEKARAATFRALELNSTLADAHGCLGAVLAVSELNWAAAEREFKYALALNPESALARHWYAMALLTPKGKTEQAIAEMKRAVELDPLSLIYNSTLAWIYYLNERWESAAEQCARSLEIDPNHFESLWCLGATYSELGRKEEGVVIFQRLMSMSAGAPLMLGSIGHNYAKMGMRKEAEGVLRDLAEAAKQGYFSPIYAAWTYANLPDHDKAFECLEKAYEDRDFQIRYIHQSPALRALREDPRFAVLLRKMDLDNSEIHPQPDATATVTYRTT